MSTHKLISRKSTKQHLLDTSLCAKAQLEISRNIPHSIFQEYYSSIVNGINKFISNHKIQLQHFLNISSNIQSHTNTKQIFDINIRCKHLNLADDVEAAPFKIPSFIDFFKWCSFYVIC